jgi:hypothetical protein
MSQISCEGRAVQSMVDEGPALTIEDTLEREPEQAKPGMAGSELTRKSICPRGSLRGS